MLARSYRFHGHRSLQNVYRHGRQTKGSLFTVKTIATPNRKKSRAAVVVSKKVSKSAVIRNRIRRRIYEIIRPVLANTPKTHDVVFIIHDERVAIIPQAELITVIQSQLSLTKDK